MTPTQIQLLRQTWDEVAAMGADAALLFYARLFEIDPTTRRLFAEADLTAQSNKLMTALAGVVQGLDHLEILLPTLEDLGRRHTGYGVTDAHYDSVGAALLWTLEQAMGARWSAEAELAWADAYGFIADVMRNAAWRDASRMGTVTLADG